jgi:hypothetical protein
MSCTTDQPESMQELCGVAEETGKEGGNYEEFPI